MITLGGLGPAIIGVMMTETVLGFLFMSLRFWTRLKLSLGGLGWEDFLLASTWVCLAIFSALCSASALAGMGQHSIDLTPTQRIHATKIEVIGQAFGTFGLATSKSAVAALLLRIVLNRGHKFALWWCIVTNFIFTSLVVIAIYVQCTPVEAVWNPYITNAKCTINLGQMSVGYAAYGSAIDFFLAALPWHALRNLQMNPRQKLVINISLSLGVFSGFCGVMRTIEVRNLDAKDDYMYKTVPSMLWSATELMLTLVCVCGPSFRPLYRHIFKGMDGSDKEYPNHPYALNDMSRSGYTGNHSGRGTFTAGVHATQTSKVGRGSEESILRNDDGAEGIKMTRSVVVEYDNTDSRTSQSGE